MTIDGRDITANEQHAFGVGFNAGHRAGERDTRASPEWVAARYVIDAARMILVESDPGFHAIRADTLRRALAQYDRATEPDDWVATDLGDMTP